MVTSNSDSKNINSVFWIDSLSEENKRIEMRITKKAASLIAQPSLIVGTADWNEAIRKFAQSFLYKKTTNSYYRLMTTYLGKPLGIDIRISNHPAGDDDNWHLTEGNGLANYRLSIYFRGDTSASTKDCSDGVTLYEQGFHYKHLKNMEVIAAIRNGIIGFMKSGVYQEVKQPQIESDDVVAERIRQEQIERNKLKMQRGFVGTIEPTNDNNANESKTMKYMKTNKRTITESQLRNIIAESVKKVLKEGYGDDSSWEEYYSHKSDDALNKIAKLLLQAQRELEPLVNQNEGEKYLIVSQHIGSLLHTIKTL